MSVNSVVYCNLCPLKEFCKYARPNDAYWWSRSNHAVNEYEAQQFAIKSDFMKLKQATSACPLRVFIG